MAPNGFRVPCWPGLSTARQIAADAGVRTVGTQHVLLAVLRRADPAAAAVLRAGGVDEGAVLAALRGIAGTGCRTEPVHVDWVAVSPRVLAVVREATAGAPETGTATDLQVLDALLAGDEPSLARLVLSSLGAHRRVLHALRVRGSEIDDAGGGLIGA